MSMHQRLAVLIGLCLVPTACSAQQGIFDEPAGLFDEAAAPAKPEAEQETRDDPLGLRGA